MSGKHILKLIVTLLVVAVSVSYLIPIKDKDFSVYLRENTDNAEFLSILERAEALEKDEESSISSVYMGIKSIARDERIDLSGFFPEIPLESSLKNLEKRNQLLLSELHARSKSKLKRGLDIEGGISVTFQADPSQFANDNEYASKAKLSKALEILEQRVNTYGVSEPVVRKSGDYRIEVQLAGISTKQNPDLITDISAPAKLEFREVHKTMRPGAGPAPFGYEALTRRDESGNDVFEETLYVKQIPALTGKYVKTANAIPQDIGSQYYVSLNFDNDGAELFGNVTRELAGTGRLAIVLDGLLISAPNVNEPITGGRAQITGDYTRREAESLANALNNPLDIRLDVAELYEVGPTLAKDSINSGIKAAAIGASLVSIFMIIYYMAGGLIALISVIINIVIVLGMLASFQATLTLPGIAGIILTVGMAVDSNILIFERIREELNMGKSLKAALVGGFDKVFSTIFDANLTTFIVSITMVSFGTGPVKGFGVALAIGVVTTMFCALVVSRLLLELTIESAGLKKFAMLTIIKKPSFDFLKPRKIAFAVSWMVVLVGIIGVFVKRDSIFGIDFQGGDEITMTFSEKIDESSVRKAIESAGGMGEVNPQYFEPIGGADEILKLQTEFKKGKEVATVLQAAFPEAGFEISGESQIGPSVGSEIQMNALKAVGISLSLILLYIAIRFEIGYGVGAIVATVHDILLTIGVFVLFGHQFTAPMVAAILLIVGYSLNDTIVLFDRIREELQLRPTTKLYEVVNIAMNAVLSRSLLTSITTLLAAVSLMIWGTGVINDIAFTFTIGIITGTFSSIFIASPVFFFWHKGDRRSVEKSHDEAPEYDWQAAAKPETKNT